jgi:cobalt-zinc-cadmium efflux system membrane fusion protein
MNARQKLITAAIVAATALAGAGVWFAGGKPSGAEQEGHGHAEGHDDKEHDAEGKKESGEEKPAADKAAAASSPEAADDGHGHGEGAGHEGEEGGDVVRLSAQQIKANDIQLAKVEGGAIRTGTEFPGEVRFNADRTAQIAPRVSGVVEAVSADLGQQVRKGQVLAVIASSDLSSQRAALLAARERAATARATFDREKRLWEQKISAEQDYLQAQQALREADIELRNAQQRLLAVGASLEAGSAGALSRYEIRAPFDGTIIEKRLALGEAVASDATVFVLSDLTTVWVELNVSSRDLEKVQVGAAASIKAAGSNTVAAGKVSYVGSLLGTQTRSATARITLINPNRAWRPGLFVNVSVLTEQAQVPLVVRNDAIQTVEDKPSVFIRTDEGFAAAPLKLGRSDGSNTEVLSGLKAGQDYAVTNSFLLKAELGKGSAEHSH